MEGSQTLIESLQGLPQYLFPGLSSGELHKDPYLPFTKMYLSTVTDSTFYRGYLRPSPLERAKIYRALTLCCAGDIRKFLIFTSSEGLIIRTKPVPHLALISDRFDQLLKDPDDLIFLPRGNEHLTEDQYPYHYKLLQLFRKTLSIDTRIISMQEYESKMLFLSGEKSLKGIQKRWNRFLGGTLTQKIFFSPFQIKSALAIYPWTYREQFKVQPDQIQLSVLEYLPENAQKRCSLINESVGDLGLHTVDIGVPVLNQHELFGLLLILSEIWSDKISDMIPLIGTSKLILPYSPDLTQTSIRNAILQFTPPLLPESEVEIYTQEPFLEMSNLKKANLIKAPSGHWYSLVDLVQTQLEKDPITREEFSFEFRDIVQRKLDQTKIGLQGFPPPKCPEPECIQVTSEEGGNSFYIRVSHEETFLLWKLPPMDDDFISDVTTILKIKLTDGSLFGPFKETCIKYKLDPTLILAPGVYSLFHEILENPAVVFTEEKVRNQLNLLKTL